MKILIFVLLASVLLTPVTSRVCEGQLRGCLNCDEATGRSCNMCDDGFQLLFDDGEGFCLNCPQKKGKARDTVPQIAETTCNVDCEASCHNCAGTPDKCTQCPAGYYLSRATSSCHFCEGGKGIGIFFFYRPQSEDSLCDVTCSAGCNNCYSSTNCIACKAGYKYNPVSKSCSRCEEGTGRAADITPQTAATTCAVTCSEGCKWCEGIGSKCQACKAGYAFDAQSGSCTKCPAGITAPESDPTTGLSTECNVVCDSKCATCEGTATKCLGCAAGHYFTKLTNSCTICELGKGRGADLSTPADSTTCTVDCVSPCKYCGATGTECLGCIEHNRFSKAGNQCLECPPGFTKGADTKIQLKDASCNIACNPTCSLCEGTANNCVGCKAGHYYTLDSKSCTSCAIAYGIEEDAVKRTSSSECLAQCDPSCQTCGAESTTCLACDVHKYLDWATNQCKDCNTPGFTRAADTGSQTGGTTCDLKCANGCKYCLGSATNCLGCAAGFYFDSNTCTTCAAGSGNPEDPAPATGTTSCTVASCSANCEFCGSSASECLGCKKGYRLDFLAKECVLCSGGTGKAADTSAQLGDTFCDIECVAGCETCDDNASSCLRCDQAYFKNDEGVCTLCERGSGKPKDVQITSPGSEDGIAECNVQCDPSCVNCKAAGPGNCLGCTASYRGTAIGVCELCGNGKFGADRTRYTKLPSPSGECTADCHASCNSCSEATEDDCLACANGYYWAGAGKCTACPAGKGKLADNSVQSGASLDETACFTCDPSCQTCNGPTANDCLSCPANREKTDAGQCKACLAGKTKVADTVGQAPGRCLDDCDVTCWTCTGTTSNDCTTCKDGHYFDSEFGCKKCPAGTGSLINPNEPTPIQTDAICTIPCHPSCQICSGPEINQCLACSAGYWWSGNGVCNECDLDNGSPGDASTKQKTPAVLKASACSFNDCHNSCKICKGTEANHCILCAAGFYMTNAGLCEICPLGTGKPADTELFVGVEACYLRCDPSCGTCYDEAQLNCLTCAPDHYLGALGSCSECMITGKGRAIQTVVATQAEIAVSVCTVTCHPACLKCSGTTANDCLLCNAGYFRSAGSTCTLCPAGTGKVAEGMPQLSATGTGEDVCLLQCHSSCSVCTDETSTGCLVCKASYYFQTPGTCTLCPDNSGMAAGTAPLTTSQQASQCIACTGCLSCGATATHCTRCDRGKYLTSDNTCTMCADGTGKAADSAPTTPSVNNGADKCTSCHSSCNNCFSSEPEGCLNCAQDYHWTGATALCAACEPKKHKLRDSAIKAGASAPAETCDVTCAFSCNKCFTTATNCRFCDPGFYYSAAGTCTLCSSGTGKQGDNSEVSIDATGATCSPCHASCDRCSGTTSSDCLHCAAGHYLSAAGVCTLCPPGSGNTLAAAPNPWGSPISQSGVAAACSLECHSTCSSCSVGNDATKCIGCNAGHYLTPAGTCAPCDSGSGKSADSSIPTPSATSAGACSACHKSCALCKGPNANDCLLCSAGYYLSAANTCTICGNHSGKVADTDLAAQISTNNGGDKCNLNCDKTCGTCDAEGTGKCLSCAAGFYYSATGVCTKCADGTGKPLDDEVRTAVQNSDACTVTCDAACLICSDQTTTGCVMCSAGFYYSAANTCTLCPLGGGKVKDDTYPAVIVAEDATCGIECHPTCWTCLGSGENQCLNCAAGFYYSGQGTCTGCQPPKGKSGDATTYKTAQSPNTCGDDCDSSCNKCEGTGASKCLNCNDGYFLSAAGTCSPCATGKGSKKDLPSVFTYPSAGDTSTCNVNCVYPCITCRDNTANGCLSCDAGHFLSAAGKCTVCSSGKGKAADPIGASLTTTSDLACNKDCTEGCDLCSSDTPNTCLACKPGYYRSDDNVCSICDLGTGGPGSLLNAEKVTIEIGCPATCDSSCLTCSGSAANQCLRCKAGLYLSAQGTCEICPFGFGKIGDAVVQAKSTDGGIAQCGLTCHATCRTCNAADLATACLSCRAGHFLTESGECTACPPTKGKPADVAFPTEPQTNAACTATCHSSCQTCAGPTENDCASCGAGHWWSGNGLGIIQKCTPCPKSRGKAADSNLLPTFPDSADSCTTYCDLCEAGCLTCSEVPSECALCIDTKYLTAEKACQDCPENCLKCSDATKCETCDADYELTTDGKTCMKCQVMNCDTCTDDPYKCTKCADKFTLKSPTECVYEPKQQPLALNLSSISIASTPQLAMNILDNTLELPFSARESQNFVAITMEDANDNKVYTCAELRCTYSIKNEKLKFEFDTDLTIKKGKLKIDRGADSRKTSIVDTSSHKNTRLLQELANYPITIDGVSLMKKSGLSKAAFASRVIVGILRLPLSLLVFWKFPHLAMMMDHMVTHLKVYSLMSQPYLAYVEVTFQSVSDSKILPFNFDNPFEHWNSNTLECEGFVGLRSKNMYCSFFDNYGENIIGIASVILTCVILIVLSKKMLQNSNMATSPRNFWLIISKYYGLHFVISKIDANHLEIALMTLIAYATADHSSKSVIGIIFGTVVLIAFGFVARHVTNAVKRVYQSNTPSAVNANSAPQVSTETALIEGESASDIALDTEIATFVISDSTTPSNKWAQYFFAARYIRAMLLVIFVATVRDPVDQVVLVVILESVYLVALILLDFRGSKLERFFYIGMHTVILLHLICRAVATSKTISEDALQSSLATAIVVFLMIYVFAHVVACLFVVVGIFLKNFAKQTTSPVNAGSTKIEMTEPRKPHEGYTEQPAPQEQPQAYNPGSPISYMDMPVPPEVYANGRGPSVHNGIASMQQNPNQSPISYMEMPVPPEMNGTVRGNSAYNGRDALVERNTNRPQPSFVDMDIPEE